MSALGGGTSLTVAMAFLCIFFGSISLLFFILRLRQKKAEFKDETEKFYPNFLHLFAHQAVTTHYSLRRFPFP